jgi:hypothetical protein
VGTRLDVRDLGWLYLNLKLCQEVRGFLYLGLESLGGYFLVLLLLPVRYSVFTV